MATVVLVVVGIVLVITGGDDHPTAPSTTTTPAGSATRPTLDLSHTSSAAVARMAGLVIPAGDADFLTASTEDRSQLDVTFTLPENQMASFVEGSKLPALVAGDRVINHSSPLWKLNPEGTVSGAADTHGGVARAVESVPEGTRVRIRVVLSPAG